MNLIAATIACLNDFLREGGIDPQMVRSNPPPVPEIKDEFRFGVDPGFSVFVRLYEWEAGELFLMVEAALLTLDERSEATILRAAAEYNRDLVGPTKIAIGDDLLLYTMRIQLTERSVTEELPEDLDCFLMGAQHVFQEIGKIAPVEPFVQQYPPDAKRAH